VTQLHPELPAAATTIAPWFVAYDTAAFNVEELVVPAYETLMTRAPWSAAQTMPDAMSLYVADVVFVIFTGMSLHDQQ
jgi:hypothetical protein